MIRGRFGRKAAALGIGAAALTSLVAAAPAQAAATGANAVYADCVVGSYGEDRDGVWISCGDVVGGEARGKADCAAAPDIHTDWITGWKYAKDGFCWFDMRRAVLQTRSY
ncbi:hypothetical protein AB0N09_33270 [Streptomyces erythrochromogenes]|uniref:hypothetical protein n=1 Tax=Streptomyces erythrochromogenes TaxID=285574 RepID=UPI0034358B48